MNAKPVSFLCAMLLASSCASRPQVEHEDSAATAPGTLALRIGDSGGSPLVGAEVAVPGSPAAVADAEGIARLAGVPSGVRRVRVAMPGYVPQWCQVTVHGGTTAGCAARLRRFGTVQLVDSSVPLDLTDHGEARVLAAAGAFGGTDAPQRIALTAFGSEPGPTRVLPGDPRLADGAMLSCAGALDVRAFAANGDGLELAPGATLTLVFPCRSPEQALPLWYLDPTAGNWIAVGEARRDARGAFRTEVPHTGTFALGSAVPTARLRLEVGAGAADAVAVVGAGWQEIVALDASRRAPCSVAADATVDLYLLRGFDLELVASGVPMPAQDRQHTLRLPDSNRLGGSGR